MVRPSVEEVLKHLRDEFPDADVKLVPDGNGGGDVIIEPIDLGDAFKPISTWIGAKLSPQLPYADIYPLFIGSDVTRNDGRPLGGPITSGHSFASRSALQVSRRTNNLVATPHAAALKFRKVLSFVMENTK